MSWRASAYIKALIQCPNGELISRTEKLVALVLADSHQDKGNAFTFPAVKTIAADSLMDPRVCRRILGSLERKGVIVRLRAERQGRGQITSYRFPELDGKGGHVVPLSGSEKGGILTPIFTPKRRTEGGRKEDKTVPPSIEEQEHERKNKYTPNPLVTEGARERETCDAGEKEKSVAQVPMDFFDGGTPPPARDVERKAVEASPVGAADRSGRDRGKLEELPAAGRALECAIDQVMQACGFTARRLRAALRAQILLDVDKGGEAPTVALAMIAAWKEYQRADSMLRVKWRAKTFFEEGYWRDKRSWVWDSAEIRELRLRSAAGVGSIQ